MPDEINVAFDIIIAAHNAPGPTEDGGFKDRVIVWVPALAEVAGRCNFDSACGQQMQELACFGGANFILIGNARARKHVGEFVQYSYRNYDLKSPI